MKNEIHEQLELAHFYHDQKIQVIPLPIGSKGGPGIYWKYHTVKPQTEKDIDELFMYERKNIALVGGGYSGNKFIIDFDKPGAFSRACLNVKYFSDIASHTLSCSARRGPHLVIDPSEPVLGTNFYPGGDYEKGEKPEGQILAHALALFPNSIHPKGDQYQFLFDDNIQPVFKLDLDDPKLKDVIQYFNLQKAKTDIPVNYQGKHIQIIGRPHGFPKRLWDLLTLGDLDGRYISRSEVDQAIITWSVNQGWGYDTIYELFRRFSCEESKFRDKGRGHAYLKTCYKNAAEYVHENRRKTDRTLDDLYNFARSIQWQGRTGRTDKAVYLSMLDIARQKGSLELGASIREIAERTGTHKDTAWKALNRLPYILRIKPAENDIPDTFKIITQNIEGVARTDNPSRKWGGEGMSVDATLDLFRHRGLGKTGADIFQALLSLNDFCDIPTLAQLSSVHRQTIDRKLDIMEKAGLIEIKGNEYGKKIKAVKHADLNRAAQIVGTAGKGEAEKRQHKRERENYKAYLNTPRH